MTVTKKKGSTNYVLATKDPLTELFLILSKGYTLI